MALSKQKKKALQKQIEVWSEAGEHQKCIEELEAIPKTDQDYDTEMLLAGVYVDAVYSQLGEDSDAELGEEDKRLLRKAVGILRPMEAEGCEDPDWNFYMMCAIGGLGGDNAEVERYAVRALDMDSEELEQMKQSFAHMKDMEATGYTEKEEPVIEEHVSKYFGDWDDIIYSSLDENDYAFDICQISPSKERYYYTLVTQGCGAMPMNVPDDMLEFAHAELVFRLPADWKLNGRSMRDERWDWPRHLLSNMVGSAHDEDNFLFYGKYFYMDGNKPFARGTGFCGAVLLTDPSCPDASVCVLPDDTKVNFYTVVPLYAEELEFLRKNSIEEFVKKCPPEMLSGALDLKRRNVITGEAWKPQRSPKKKR